MVGLIASSDIAGCGIEKAYSAGTLQRCHAGHSVQMSDVIYNDRAQFAQHSLPCHVRNNHTGL